MIRLGNSARFTPHEVDEFRQVGLDMGSVKHQKDIEQELSRWAHVLADERFDLLEKIALELARANGAKLPTKFRVVMQSTPSRMHGNKIISKLDANGRTPAISCRRPTLLTGRFKRIAAVAGSGTNWRYRPVPDGHRSRIK